MPAILETIGAIARRLGRDVIFLDICKHNNRPSRDRSDVAGPPTGFLPQGSTGLRVLGSPRAW